LFTDYVDLFLKGKQEASGFPGLRTVMKLCFNSFWGRFGINKNKIKKKFMTLMNGMKC
jgi:hypothetical protein